MDSESLRLEVAELQAVIRDYETGRRYAHDPNSGWETPHKCYLRLFDTLLDVFGLREKWERDRVLYLGDELKRIAAERAGVVQLRRENAELRERCAQSPPTKEEP